MRHFHYTVGREAISRHPHTVGRGTGPGHAVTLNIFCLFLLTFAAPTWAWWGGGHETLTRASVKALPEELPEFFRAVFAENAIAHGAHDRTSGETVARRMHAKRSTLNTILTWSCYKADPSPRICARILNCVQSSARRITKWERCRMRWRSGQSGSPSPSRSIENGRTIP